MWPRRSAGGLLRAAHVPSSNVHRTHRSIAKQQLVTPPSGVGLGGPPGKLKLHIGSTSNDNLDHRRTSAFVLYATLFSSLCVVKYSTAAGKLKSQIPLKLCPCSNYMRQPSRVPQCTNRNILTHSMVTQAVARNVSASNVCLRVRQCVQQTTIARNASAAAQLGKL